MTVDPHAIHISIAENDLRAASLSLHRFFSRAFICSPVFDNPLGRMVGDQKANTVAHKPYYAVASTFGTAFYPVQIPSRMRS
jgi:hypothetical protein